MNDTYICYQIVGLYNRPDLVSRQRVIDNKEYNIIIYGVIDNINYTTYLSPT